MKTPLRIAAAQFDAESGDIDHIIACHIELISVAANEGAALVVFPELSITGYCASLLDQDSFALAVDPAGKAMAKLRSACESSNIAAVVGAPVVGAAGLHLSSIAIGREGGIETAYDKMYLDSDEKRWFVRGEKPRQITVDGWRLGLGICYDSSFPEHARGYALSGADVYVLSGAFPRGRSDYRRSIYFPARSLENTMFLAFSNYVGAHDGLEYGGMSAIHGPDGECLCDAGPTGHGLAMVSLDHAHLLEIRRNLQMLQDCRES